MFAVDSAIEKGDTQLKKKILAHSKLSLLLNNNNMAWSFVGRLDQVISTYVLWKFKTINVTKSKI